MATDELFRRAKRARRDAETAAARDLTAWVTAKRAEIDADASLTDEERAAAKRALFHEFGRRSKNAIAKAKRDNTPAKLVMRDAQAAIDARDDR